MQVFNVNMGKGLMNRYMARRNVISTLALLCVFLCYDSLALFFFLGRGDNSSNKYENRKINSTLVSPCVFPLLCSFALLRLGRQLQ